MNLLILTFSDFQACGFVILVSHVKGNDNSLDVSNDRGWIKYHQSLTDKGYFKVFRCRLSRLMIVHVYIVLIVL